MRTPTLVALLVAAATSLTAVAPALAASPAAKPSAANASEPAAPKPSTCSLPDLVCKTTAPATAPQTNVGCTASCLPDQGKAVCSAGKCEAGQFTKMNTCQCTK
ncbi:MAG: hypothetical protein IPK07_12960 [Deltaproteobacteria bacterium]|nr:hypothetical protein [Deltaproteobacteria bacterium]